MGLLGLVTQCLQLFSERFFWFFLFFWTPAGFHDCFSCLEKYSVSSVQGEGTNGRPHVYDSRRDGRCPNGLFLTSSCVLTTVPLLRFTQLMLRSLLVLLFLWRLFASFLDFEPRFELELLKVKILFYTKDHPGFLMRDFDKYYHVKSRFYFIFKYSFLYNLWSFLSCFSSCFWFLMKCAGCLIWRWYISHIIAEHMSSGTLHTSKKVFPLI